MKKSVLTVLIFLCASLLFAFDSYYVEDYNVDVTVGRNAVHHIREDYVVNFLTPHHGIVRYVPLDYSSVKTIAKINDIKCNCDYSTSYEDGYFVMQIGDEDKKVSGLVPYAIEYDFDIGEDINEGYDLFIFNLLGEYWEVPFGKVSFTVQLEGRIPQSDISLYRDFGSVAFDVTYSGDTTVISGESFNHYAGESLTIQVRLPEGWYQGARQPWDYKGIFVSLSPIVCLALVALVCILWSLYGRDDVPVVMARFTEPHGFSPLFVGYLIDNTVDDKDITSMLFYWADKGYISISEKKKNKFEFIKLADLPFDTPQAERDLFYGFFKRNVQTVENLQKDNFAQTMEEVKLSVHKYFTKGKSLNSVKSIVFAIVFTVIGAFIPALMLGCRVGLSEFEVNTAMPSAFVPMLVGSVVQAIALFSLFRTWYIRKTKALPIIISAAIPVLEFLLISFLISGYGVKISVLGLACPILSASVIIFFAQIMPKRSKYGHELFEEILGFREFIDKVSMDELKLMIDENPQFYYHILSYAIVLGLENKWAKKFAGVAVPPPTWYVGNSVYNNLFWANMYMRMNTSIKTHAVPATAKGHSGASFSMGGFAGGGFGGGGGHAW